ncbi:MAG TPA: nuclear transport factor 2 family protein [Bacillota bacterium]|nr:nuclear transport factor 2 family protein [Bacillota bacterium]
MKKIFVTSLFLLGLGLAPLMVRASGDGKQFDPEDAEAIRRACLDYVEGFYDSDAERIKKGVHPDLAKRSIAPGEILSNMNRNALINAAVSNIWKKPAINVEIFDINGPIASAKITSDYIDYVQLAKLKGEWQIVNVLWR